MSVAAAPPRFASQELMSSVLPAPSQLMVVSKAAEVMMGLMVSRTVTVALAELELPHSSVEDRDTVCGVPTSLQSKEVGAAVNVKGVVQLSEDPLSMSAAVKEPLPLASK